MEALPWPVIGSGTGWAAFMVLAFFVLRAVVKGDWVPRSTHERELNAKEHDANEWRTEGRIKDQAILVELEHLNTKADQQGMSLHQFLSAMQQASPRRKGD